MPAGTLNKVNSDELRVFANRDWRAIARAKREHQVRVFRERGDTLSAPIELTPLPAAGVSILDDRGFARFLVDAARIFTNLRNDGPTSHDHSRSV